MIFAIFRCVGGPWNGEQDAIFPFGKEYHAKDETHKKQTTNSPKRTISNLRQSSEVGSEMRSVTGQSGDASSSTRFCT